MAGPFEEVSIMQQKNLDMLPSSLLAATSTIYIMLKSLQE